MNFFTLIATPFGYLISWLYSLTNDYLLAVFITAVAFNICFIWRDILKQRAAKKLGVIMPDILEIQQKYPNAQFNKEEKKQMKKEITEIYNKNNYTGASTFISSFLIIITNIIFFSAIMNPLYFITGLDVDTISNIKDTLISLGVNFTGYTQFDIINHINNGNMADIISIVPNIADLTIPNLQFGIFNLGNKPSLFAPSIIFPIIIISSSLFPIIKSKKITISDFKNFTYESFSRIFSNLSSVLITSIIAFKVPVLICLYILFMMVFNIAKNFAFKNINKIKNRKECLKTDLQTNKI